MNISNAHNSSSTTCDQLKKENEELKEELHAYRQLLDINEPHSESENISFSIDETVAPEDDSMVPDVSDIAFIEPIILRNIDEEEDRITGYTDFEIETYSDEEKTSAE